MLTRQEYSAVAVEERIMPECRHHWIIEPAIAPSSGGVCLLCGEKREFQTYINVLESWNRMARARPQGFPA